MAGTIKAGGDIAGAFSRIQADQFSGHMERTQLQVQLALQKQQVRDYAALQDKYDGSKEARIEAEIDTLFAKKSKLATQVSRLESAVKEFNDVRIDLYEIKDASTGAAAAFDTEINQLNTQVGNRKLYPHRLLGNPGHGNGSWLSDSTVVDTGIISTTVTTKFLGVDYYIELDAGGGRFTPDLENRTLGGPASISFDNLQLDSYDSATGAIQFTDTTGPTVYNGTLYKGGTGIMSGWLYNNLVGAGDQTNAQDDVDTAIQTMIDTERDYKINLTMIKSAVSKLNTQIDNLADEFKRVSAEELSAKQAERRAIAQKFDLAMNNVSLTSNVSVTLIQNLFNSPNIYGKKDVFDILLG